MNDNISTIPNVSILQTHGTNIPSQPLKPLEHALECENKIENVNNNERELSNGLKVRKKQARIRGTCYPLPMTKHKHGSNLTTTEINNVIKDLLETNYNISKTAKNTNHDRRTIYNVLNNYPDRFEQFKSALSNKLMDNAAVFIQHMTLKNNLKKTSSAQSAMISGIMIDKALLLRGQPTEISKTIIDNMTDDDLKRYILDENDIIDVPGNDINNSDINASDKKIKHDNDELSRADADIDKANNNDNHNDIIDSNDKSSTVTRR